ncbi:MAG: hypothetical protein ACYTFK_08080 [Planctomycetota bacterium]|jgi:hypothetical protein
MAIKEKLRHIGAELKGHAPFTAFGAVMGIIFMLIFKDMGKDHANMLFSIFHPAHVVLSAMVTASLFTIHRKAKNFLLVLVIGYVGSIGIATLSDSVVPHLGESLLGLDVPTHAEVHGDHFGDEHEHEHEHEEDVSQETHGIHLGFIEDWYIVNPAAVLGVLIACFLPRTKFPHAGHVLISTWASSSHILMNTHNDITFSIMAAIFVILFIAVWLPCCISDIIFPLLFVKSDLKLTNICVCSQHAIHSHPHEHEHSAECPGPEEDH